MADPEIPFGRPILGQAEIDAVTEVLAGTTLVHGPVTEAFETRFAERIGTKHAVAVSSCTAGLHLSLLANEIGDGDEVIVPAMTHVATAHVVEFCGATPVFVDVEADTGNLDSNALLEVMSPRTRATLPVHYLGLPCDIEKIEAHYSSGVVTIEDCALAVDAHFGDLKAGALGQTGSFSFYPIKHLTSIEGGMVTTDDEQIAAAIRQRRAFGYDRSVGERKRPGIYDVTVLGYNYRMSEVEAAVGLAQMSRLDEHQRTRKSNFRSLYEILEDIDEISLLSRRKGKAVSSHYCINAILPRDGSINRDTVVAHLKSNGIGTSVHYPRAVPLMAYYREKYGFADGQFPVAEWLAAQSISLPIAPHVNADDIARIGESVKEAIHAAH